MYTYHIMEIADYDEIYKLWDSIFGDDLGVADSHGRIAGYLEQNPGQSFVCRHSGEIVATILCGNDGRRAYIHHTAVASEHRRQGIAAELVRLALGEQTKLGIDKCHLFVFNENESGKNFWRETGFVLRQDISIMSRNL